MRLQTGASSHVGRVRSINEDAVGVFNRPVALFGRGGHPLFVLADGMGGHQAGEVASQLAVRTVRATFQQAVRNAAPQDALHEAVVAANSALRARAAEAASLANMGTTLVVATMTEQSLHVANVGDSRAYLVRNEEIQPLTRDHSLAAERARLLNEQQPADGPGRNVLTRSVGLRDHVEVDLFEQAWLPGDILLLCSDGLWGFVSDAQMLTALLQLTAQAAAERLVRLAMISRSTDNISAVVVRRVK